MAEIEHFLLVRHDPVPASDLLVAYSMQVSWLSYMKQDLELLALEVDSEQVHQIQPDFWSVPIAPINSVHRGQDPHF
jgi:hypothetical protein